MTGARAPAALSLTLVVFLAVIFDGAPSRAACLDAVRAILAKVMAPEKKIENAAHELLAKGGRAQESAVDAILDAKLAEADRLPGGAADPAAWTGFVDRWQSDLIERMTDPGSKNYPKIEELLAVMSARSPTFKQGLAEFLHDHGELRYKILEVMKDDAGGGAGEVAGRPSRLLPTTTIKVPTRKTWTPDEFGKFMTEISDSVFRASHPEPKFAMTWLRSFGDIDFKDPETWKVWQSFAARVQSDYRARYLDFMNGVARESFGEPRPEVVAEFYKWGIRDAIYRRLAAFKVALSKSGADLIEKHTQLTVGEVSALNANPFFKALPQSARNAIIIAKDPGLKAALLLDQETERLSLELMWFVQPVIEAGVLYTTIPTAYGGYEAWKKNRKVSADIKAHPQKYFPDTKRADDDRIANFDEQLKSYAAERDGLQHELDTDHSLTPDEQAKRRQSIAALNTRIRNVQGLKDDLLAHPGPVGASGAAH